ncbi:MAG: DUF86 domain-containing protein [Thermoflexaceae bacterium]|nr:DUF86 domain-containing protein [Thermoflexaceae bacterium]
MTRHDPLGSLEDMLRYAQDALEIAEGWPLEAQEADRWRTFALVHCVELIGEAASRVPATFRESHPGIPFGEAIGMRNRLIHAYDSIDMAVVWAVVRNELPPLVAALREILEGRRD